MNITLASKQGKSKNIVRLVDSVSQLENVLNKRELKITRQGLKKNNWVDLSNLDEKRFVILLVKNKPETNRRLGSELYGKIETITFIDHSNYPDSLLEFLEGLILKSYQFNKYKSPIELNQKKVQLFSTGIKKSQLQELIHLKEAVFTARNWVNEPVNQLNTQQFVEEVKVMESYGIAVEILEKSKLQTLNMGGVLGVNKGSNDDPVLIKCEWKPSNAMNKKPIVLVGKGVLFDTGGINIKTGDFMKNMKADMGGAATVLGALKAVALQKLLVHVIVLTPVTENRINGNELVPGDVISMHNGKTVEVLNTDAEGRLILADALAFAKKFDPSIVIDAATLTGSAYRVTGHNGAIVMGTDSKNIAQMKQEGETQYERLIELPMWEEFDETLKSDIADMNNLGTSEGQAVCAGLFLKKFTSYPWIHLDIAGPSFRSESSNYLPKGGSGFGVRLLYRFIKNNFAR